MLIGASQFAIAASKFALADARVFRHPGECLKGWNRPRLRVLRPFKLRGVSRGQVLKGFLDLNPMLFPNTVPNAAASNASIELGIRG